jgi:formylglycine-generating enzyme required for sulfatase activity
MAETSHAPATGSGDGVRCPACLLPVDDDEGDFCEHCGATLFTAAQAAFTEPTQVSEAATDAEPPIVRRESLEVTEVPQSVEESVTEYDAVEERVADSDADELIEPVLVLTAPSHATTPGAAFSDENIEPEYVPADDGLVETGGQVALDEILPSEGDDDETLTTEAAAAVDEAEDQAVDRVENGVEVQAPRAEVEAPPTVLPTFVEEEFLIETPGDSEALDDRAAVPAQREEQESPDVSRQNEIFEFGSTAASDQGSTRRWLIPGGVALCLLLAGTAALFKLSGTRSNSAAVTSGTATPAPAGTDAQTQPPAPAPEGMVLVSGGSFEMGRNDGDEYERPAHAVSVKPFYIDVHEVTCAKYAKFVAAEKHASPPTWPGGVYDPANALLPVTGVNWDDAQAYARWAGGRLPTEDEWEFAARGTDGRLYPWGNAWQPNSANAAQTSAGRMVPVGSYSAGASPSGALDMVGNAWEWTASSLKAYPGGSLPQAPEADLMVIRGNYWNGKATQATTTFRRGYPARGEDYKNTGFRCARDVVAAAR